MLYLSKTLKHLKIINCLKMDSVKSLNTLIDKEEEDQVESLVKKQKLNDDDLSKIGENKLVKKRKYALLIGYQGM